jgi:hypothetical protein
LSCFLSYFLFQPNRGTGAVTIKRDEKQQTTFPAQSGQVEKDLALPEVLFAEVLSHVGYRRGVVQQKNKVLDGWTCRKTFY